ncbi:MAG: hypothetical protein H6R18_1255 [Proteobacteria bacterium]|nr:hypothetical protein [Pseudomonadota bacterium]
MAKCAIQTTVYAFAGSAGNTRTAYSLPVLNNTAPASCPGLIVLSPAEYLKYEEAMQSTVGTFDYANASLIFGFFFSFTVGCWWVAKNFGLVLQAVRRF